MPKQTMIASIKQLQKQFVTLQQLATQVKTTCKVEQQLSIIVDMADQVVDPDTQKVTAYPQIQSIYHNIASDINKPFAVIIQSVGYSGSQLGLSAYEVQLYLEGIAMGCNVSNKQHSEF